MSARRGSPGSRSASNSSAVPQDHRQQIVEVVGHAGGQPSDGFPLLSLLILLLQRAALSDVGARTERPDDLPLVTPVHGVAPFDQPFFARPGEHGFSAMERSPLTKSWSVALTVSRTLGRQARLGPIAPRQLILGPSQNVGALAIDRATFPSRSRANRMTSAVSRYRRARSRSCRRPTPPLCARRPRARARPPAVAPPGVVAVLVDAADLAGQCHAGVHRPREGPPSLPTRQIQPETWAGDAIGAAKKA